jgi:hypothetical protein
MTYHFTIVHSFGGQTGTANITVEAHDKRSAERKAMKVLWDNYKSEDVKVYSFR